MNAVVSLVCIAGCALGMLLVATLLMQEHRSHANVLLACVIGVACLDELFSAVEHLSQGGGAMLRLPGFPGLLFAPLLFLYFRARSFTLRVRGADAWHFACFVALQSIALFDFLEPEVLPGLILRPYLNLACLLIIGTYALASLRVVYASALPRRCSVFHSCVLAVLALMTALASYLLGAGTDMLMPASDARGDLADAVLSCALAALACSAIYRALSREPETRPNQVIPFPDARPEPEKTKYGNNRLPDFARESIVAELKRYMQSAQPWLRIDLTLGQLAAGINVSPHHLSQIINSDFGKSFACYINEYRVDAACRWLSGDNGRSVLDIALDSGFASKSSFNALFKKHTGMTPSEYRRKFQSKNCLVA